MSVLQLGRGGDPADRLASVLHFRALLSYGSTSSSRARTVLATERIAPFRCGEKEPRRATLDRRPRTRIKMLAPRGTSRWPVAKISTHNFPPFHAPTRVLPCIFYNASVLACCGIALRRPPTSEFCFFRSRSSIREALGLQTGDCTEDHTARWSRTLPSSTSPCGTGPCGVHTEGEGFE